MPFVLTGVYGGLGNQVFILASVYAIAKRYNTSFMYIPTAEPIKSLGIIIPDYVETVLSGFLSSDTHSVINFAAYPIIMQVLVPQFHNFVLPDTIDIHTTLIHIKGMPMYYSIIEPYIDSISQILYKTKELYVPTSIKQPFIRKIGVMFRTYEQENAPQWMTHLDYYEKAIQYMLDQHAQTNILEFHIFSDTEGVTSTILQPIFDSLELRTYCKEYVGKRDNKTDVEHFFQMFDLDDYILCNSTYHYWPALVSTYAKDKLVTYPTYMKDGNLIEWIKHIMHPTWVQL
jgi:hypothetical protein